MLFTKTSAGVRVWFFAVRSTGEIRPGFLAGDFTTTVVNDDDTASATYAVSESTQKSGMYYFDIPKAFFATYGAGDYVIGVEIDSLGGVSPPPHVLTAFTDMLRVYTKDFEDIVNPSFDIRSSMSSSAVTATFQFWAEEDGVRLTSMTSMTAVIKNAEDVTVVNLGTDNAPTANGVFAFTTPVSNLAVNTTYIVAVAVTDGIDTWNDNINFVRVN